MGYYVENLSGERLRKVYEIAPPRVRRYLRAEIDHVLSRLSPEGSVLELGCGYGRVAFELANAAGRVVGIDTSPENLALARRLAGDSGRCEFLEMDAADLSFPDGEFDAVVCIQNGICAFGVDQKRLLGEAVRVTRSGGRVLFSSYAERFWSERLGWFQLQAELGLVGEIDREATGDGAIVCRDGFRADGSSVFCEIVVPGAA